LPSTPYSVEPQTAPGYANFVVADPALKLVLMDRRGSAGAAGALNHLGVEVDSVEEVMAARERFTAAALASFDEDDTTCCYALQDKVWVHDPAGAPWEFYVVKDDDPVDGRPATASLEVLSGGAGAVGAQSGACCT
jgi:hypothetical protein